jgi:hypothetical protein
MTAVRSVGVLPWFYARSVLVLVLVLLWAGVNKRVPPLSTEKAPFLQVRMKHELAFGVTMMR